MRTARNLVCRRLRPAAAILLAACTTVALCAAPLLMPLNAAGEGDSPPPPWHVAGLPRQAKPLTQFKLATLDGERVLRVTADESYGNLVHAVPPATEAHTLRWRWRLDEPIAQADLRRKDGDDSPVKLCAFFDEPLAAVPFVERQLLRLARGLSDELLPAASVCYVWDSRLAAGTRLVNVYTRRVRLIVLRGPDSPLHRWQAERRDIMADYLRLFGDETDTVPPLMGIGVGADADNTHGRSLAHVAEVVLE